MATSTSRRRNGSTSSKDQARAAATKQRTERKSKATQEYEEESGWGSAFHRPDNEAPQPSYTGTGVVDLETLRAIAEAADGNALCEFQISVWPRRARTGTKYLRFHVEPPYQGGSEAADLDDEDFDGNAEDSDDDLPF